MADSGFGRHSARRYGGAPSIVDGRRQAIHNPAIGMNRVELRNHAPGQTGGAIFLRDSELRLANSSLRASKAGLHGGGGYAVARSSSGYISPYSGRG